MAPTVLTAAQQKMLDFLIERARHSPGRTITYGELARALDPDFNPRDRHHVKLIRNLYRIGHYCFEQNMPLFGCLVVRAGDRQQGDGFYALARDIGLLDSEQPEDEKKFRDDQIAQTIDYARSMPEATAAAEPSITVHILQVNHEKENTDELARSVSIGCTETDWQMPKGARPGDLAVWYASGRQAGTYVAWGWVDGVPYHVEESPGPYRGTVAGMREMEKKATRQDVIDYCGVNGGVQSIQTLTGARALDFLEAVGLGLIAETVTMLAKAARRERGPAGTKT